MKKNLMFFTVATFLVFVVAGCQTTSQGSKTYTRQQAQQALTAYYGTVLKVSEVQIQGEQTGVGAVGGAVVGGIIGSTIGTVALWSLCRKKMMSSPSATVFAWSRARTVRCVSGSKRMWQGIALEPLLIILD